MTVSAVVFDLDYTLAVPRQDRETLLTDAMQLVDAPIPTREEYLDVHRRHLTCETRAPIFDELFADYETATDPDTAAAAYRDAIASSLVPVHGAESLVTDLRERYRVGLLTNGPVVAQRDKLATLGWEDLFDEAIVTGELPAGKPDGRAFEAILSALDVAADVSVYVGDEVRADVGGAKDAGLRAIQVLYDDGPPPSDRADATIERSSLTSELPDVLTAM